MFIFRLQLRTNWENQIRQRGEKQTWIVNRNHSAPDSKTSSKVVGATSSEDFSSLFFAGAQFRRW